jgi:hypothetical protein
MTPASCSISSPFCVHLCNSSITLSRTAQVFLFLFPPQFPVTSSTWRHILYILSTSLPIHPPPHGPPSRVDSESRFEIFLARILWKIRFASRENISASLVSLTSLARREKCDILWNLRVSQLASLAIYDSQTSKIILHCEKLVLGPKFSHDYRVKISNDLHMSCYEISVCETRKSRYEICLRDSREASISTKFLSAILVRSDSSYKIS